MLDCDATIKVLTLNLAHARGRAFHQYLLRRAAIEHNLDRVAEVLCRERPHLVGLQEADGPSRWSGGFDHVEYLARRAGFPHFVRGEHIRHRIASYGTAILSQIPFDETLSLQFRRSLPSPRKGLTLSRSRWPGQELIDIDVVALHLDFLRPRIRRRQVEEMARHLLERKHPRIVMGDFNCQWRGWERSLRHLAGRLELHACRPHDRSLVTFPRMATRLDWILASQHFEFLDYQVLPDRLSDHRAVVACLKLRSPAQAADPSPDSLSA